MAKRVDASKVYLLGKDYKNTDVIYTGFFVYSKDLLLCNFLAGEMINLTPGILATKKLGTVLSIKDGVGGESGVLFKVSGIAGKPLKIGRYGRLKTGDRVYVFDGVVEKPAMVPAMVKPKIRINDNTVYHFVEIARPLAGGYDFQPVLNEKGELVGFVWDYESPLKTRCMMTPIEEFVAPGGTFKNIASHYAGLKKRWKDIDKD